MCMYFETFHISVIAPNATMVIYGILFGDMHPLPHFSGDDGVDDEWSLSALPLQLLSLSATVFVSMMSQLVDSIFP